ncbi:MAG TPA: hypothetical protein VE090_03360 [Methylomirabilota bacterium]|nr:hypothetical protein [Methylomirabilota bacterium]
MDDQTKDNLTDVATQISNQPQNDNNQAQNLADNQVVGNDGTVIDLNNDDENTVNK